MAGMPNGISCPRENVVCLKTSAFPQLVVRSHFPPLRAVDSVWPASPSFSRQQSVFRQCRSFPSPQPGQTEWCAPPDGLRGKGGRRGGWCRSRIRSGRRPPFPFSFPMRSTIPRDEPASSGTSCPQADTAERFLLPPVVRFYNAGRLRVLFLQIGDGRLQGRSLDILGDTGTV